MIVRELLASFGIKTDDASFKKADSGMNNLIGLAKSAVAAFAAIGAVSWFKGIISDVTEAGDRVNDMKERTGASAETIQELGYAAKMTGASIEDVELAYKKLAMTQSQAADGTKSATDKFKKYGLSIRDQQGRLKTGSELILESADAMSKLGSDSERTAMAVDLFGRSGNRLVPMMKGGRAQLVGMMKEFDELGGLMDDDLVAAAAAWDDQLNRIDVISTSVKNTIAKALIPTLSDLAERSIKWWKLNRQGISMRLEKAFSFIAEKISSVAVAIGKATDFLFNFFSNLSPNSKAVMGALAALILINKAFKAGPIGKFMLLLGAILALLEDFNVFMEGGNSLLGVFLDKIKKITGLDFASTIREFANGMAELAKDPKPFDWGAYWQEIKSVVSEYVQAALYEWQNLFSEFWKWLGSIVEEYIVNNPISVFFGDCLAVAGSFIGGLRDIFSSFVDLINNIWDSPLQSVKNFFSTVQDVSRIFIDNIRNVFEDLFVIFKKAWSAYKSVESSIGGIFGFGEKEKTQTQIPSARKISSASSGLSSYRASAATASAQSKTLGPVNSTSYTNITVNPGPGMSEASLARKVAAEVGKQNSQQRRMAVRAAMPVKG